MGWNEEIFFNNLGLKNGRQIFGAMVNRMAPYYTRNQIQEQLWLENKGRNKIRSPVGAMGVGQIMPATLKGLQNNYPHRGYTNPEDPAQGLQMYEDLMMENFRRAKREGLSDEAASRRGVRAYQGGWDESNWGPDNRHYDSVVNWGRTADKLKALPEGHARGPGDLFSAGTSPLEYEETPAQAAYTKGKEKELESVTNPMQGFQDIVKAQRTFAPGLYNTFMSYVNGNGRG